MTSEDKNLVTIVEVGPRDGVQNESSFVDTALKIRLVDLLSKCGFRRIEAASFVSPRWVPQMADATEVMHGITRVPGIAYSVLTPNLKGLDMALAARADEVAIFASASESFSHKNINCSIAESLELFRPVIEAARDAAILVRGYVSCVVECPYEGSIEPHAAARVTSQLLDLGCHEVSLGDTLGRGRPDTVAAMLKAVLSVAPAHRLAGHYHDTNGRAGESIEVSLEMGLRVFDSSIAGLGGCPYAPGAKGNVDTIKVDALMRRKGFATGLDQARLQAAATFAKSLRATGDGSL